MTLPSKAEAEKHEEIDRALEKLHKAGHTIETKRIPKQYERNWEAEAEMDMWAGHYARNIAMQYKEINEGQDIRCLHQILKEHPGMPVACIGAGPSLDTNIEYLRDFPGIIIASDRSAKTVTARGIKPDLVVSIDPHLEVIAEFLNYPDSAKQILIGSVHIDPKVAKTWNGKMLWMSHQNPGTQFNDVILPALFPGMPALYCVGNVGNMTVQVAAWMGAKTAVLVGQDYGYTGGKTACDQYEQDQESPNGLQWRKVNTDWDKEWRKRTGKIKHEETGIMTYPPYLRYIQTLKRMIDGIGISVVNCTEGGIIKGLPEMGLQEFNRKNNNNRPDAIKIKAEMRERVLRGN